MNADQQDFETEQHRDESQDEEFSDNEDEEFSNNEDEEFSNNEDEIKVDDERYDTEGADELMKDHKTEKEGVVRTILSIFLVIILNAFRFDKPNKTCVPSMERKAFEQLVNNCKPVFNKIFSEYFAAIMKKKAPGKVKDAEVEEKIRKMCARAARNVTLQSLRQIAVVGVIPLENLNRILHHFVYPIVASLYWFEENGTGLPAWEVAIKRDHKVDADDLYSNIVYDTFKNQTKYGLANAIDANVQDVYSETETFEFMKMYISLMMSSFVFSLPGDGKPWEEIDASQLDIPFILALHEDGMHPLSMLQEKPPAEEPKRRTSMEPSNARECTQRVQLAFQRVISTHCPHEIATAITQKVHDIKENDKEKEYFIVTRPKLDPTREPNPDFKAQDCLYEMSMGVFSDEDQRFNPTGLAASFQLSDDLFISLPEDYRGSRRSYRVPMAGREEWSKRLIAGSPDNKLIRNPTTILPRNTLAAEILKVVEKVGYGGLTVDVSSFRAVAASPQRAYVAIPVAFTNAIHVSAEPDADHGNASDEDGNADGNAYNNADGNAYNNADGNAYNNADGNAYNNTDGQQPLSKRARTNSSAQDDLGTGDHPMDSDPSPTCPPPDLDGLDADSVLEGLDVDSIFSDNYDGLNLSP